MLALQFCCCFKKLWLFWVLCKNFRIGLSVSTKTSQNFDGECIESVDKFGENYPLTILSVLIHEHFLPFIYAIILFIYFLLQLTFSIIWRYDMNWDCNVIFPQKRSNCPSIFYSPSFPHWFRMPSLSSIKSLHVNVILPSYSCYLRSVSIVIWFYYSISSSVL